MIGEGQPAPDFTLPRDGGGEVSLSALRGQKVVLYFYPKDDTPGCTTEALDFTALRDDFTAAGATVIGISRDDVASHERFCRKHGLGITLLADEDAAVAARYGVWGEKTLYGRKVMGITRSTFLIDGAGNIARIWRRVRVAGHAAAVLEAAQAL